jgi:hypothetical protein
MNIYRYIFNTEVDTLRRRRRAGSWFVSAWPACGFGRVVRSEDVTSFINRSSTPCSPRYVSI